MLTETQVSKKVQVIVQSWGDEPVVLWATTYNRNTNIIQAFGRNEQRPINLPLDIVFVYSDDLFQVLIQAYETGNKDKLLNLYKEENMDKKSCTKYQYMLSSLHEERKEISDTGRTSAGNRK